MICDRLLSGTTARYLLLLGTVLATAGNAGSAAAQGSHVGSETADEEPREISVDEEIVVTGIRASLADALEAKRDAPGIIDAVSAEDIGKFPDQNLAESLQRIPGVQITRNKGEGQGVNVRGLGGNFTRTFYNGRILPNPTAGRNFAFTSLSSDFVSRVEVQKTPTADMIDGGIASTINVKVARPLDVGRNRTSIGAEGLYESNPEKVSPHLSFYTSRVLIDDTLGVNFGASYEKRNVVQGGYTAFGLTSRAETPNNPLHDFNLDGDYEGTFRFIPSTNVWVESGYFERLNFVGGVQAKPADNVELYADVFYSRFEDYYHRTQQALIFTTIGGPGAGIVETQIDDGNIVSYLNADGVDHRGSVTDSRAKDRIASFAAGGKFEFGPLTVSAEGTYSDSKRVTRVMNVNAISRASASYDFRGGYGEIPIITFHRGYDKLDPTQFRLLSIAGNLNSPRTEKNRDLRLDLNYDINGGLLRSFKTGVYAGRAKKTIESTGYTISSRIASQVYGFPFDPTIEGGTAAAESFLVLANSTKFVPDVLGVHLYPDLDKMFGNKTLQDGLAVAPPTSNPASDYRVQEDVYAAYARLDFGTWDDNLTGNIGLRYVRTDQTSSGAAPDLSKVILLQGDISVLVPSATPVTVHNNYENWLPSLNLRWSPGRNFAIRFAANRAMTRPDLGILSPRTTISANLRTINSGNPFVKPYLADQADLSFEYYLGRAGVLSAAFFYKDVKNFIVSTQTVETHTLVRELGGTATLEFRRSQPDNGENGTVKGLELGAQVPLTFLPRPLDGFGILANLTLLDVSDVRIVDGGPLVPVAGVSDTSYTLGAYYEKGGFGLRASYTYRSDYVESQNAEFGDGTYVDAYGQLDVSASYDVNENLSVVAEAVNLTNQIQRTKNNVGVLRREMDFGRRFSLGARLRF